MRESSSQTNQIKKTETDINIEELNGYIDKIMKSANECEKNWLFILMGITGAGKSAFANLMSGKVLIKGEWENQKIVMVKGENFYVHHVPRLEEYIPPKAMTDPTVVYSIEEKKFRCFYKYKGISKRAMLDELNNGKAETQIRDSFKYLAEIPGYDTPKLFPVDEELKKAFIYQYLCENEVLFRKNINAFVGNNPDESKTSVPTLVKGERNCQFLDFPGFIDTRGPTVDVAIPVFLEMLVKKVGSIKGILLLLSEADMDATKGENRRKLMTTMSRLFRDLESIQSSIKVIITKPSGAESQIVVVRRFLAKIRRGLEKLNHDKQDEEAVLANKQQEIQILENDLKNLENNKFGTKAIEIGNKIIKKGEEEIQIQDKLRDINSEIQFYELVIHNGENGIYVFDDIKSNENIYKFLDTFTDTISKDNFNFKSFASEWKTSFENYVRKVIIEADNDYSKFDSLYSRIEENVRETIRCNNNIKNIHLHQIDTLLNEKKAQLEDVSKKLEDKKYEYSTGERELKDAESKELTEYNELTFTEKDQDFLSKLTYTTYTYRNSSLVPYEIVERTCEHPSGRVTGKWKDSDKNDNKTGIFETKYISNWRQKPYFRIIMRIKKCNLPGNIAKKPGIKEKLIEVKAEIDKFVITRNKLTTEIVDLKEQLTIKNDESALVIVTRDRLNDERTKKLLDREIDQLSELSKNEQKLKNSLQEIKEKLRQNFSFYEKWIDICRIMDIKSDGAMNFKELDNVELLFKNYSSLIISDDNSLQSTNRNIFVDFFLNNILNSSYDITNCKYLINIFNEHPPCIKIIFETKFDESDLELFSKQVGLLINLSIHFKSPALFLSNLPSSKEHFFCGLVNERKLLLIDPLGLIPGEFQCYEVLNELLQINVLNHVYLSDTVWVKQEFEQKLLSSSGTIAVEIFLNMLKNNLFDINSLIKKEQSTGPLNTSTSNTPESAICVTSPHSYENLSRKNLTYEEEIKKILKKTIPQNFYIGKAIKDEEDSFLDAAVQGININKKSSHTVKSLRMLCKKYANSNFEENIWLKDSVILDVDQMLRTDNDWENYQRMIGTTSAEINTVNGGLNEKVPHGRPHVEGVILCKKLKISIHIIELIRTSNNNENNGFKIKEKIIDHNGQKNIPAFNQENYRDANTIHMVQCSNHFVPLFETRDLQNSIQKVVHEFSGLEYSLISLETKIDSLQNLPMVNLEEDYQCRINKIRHSHHDVIKKLIKSKNNLIRKNNIVQKMFQMMMNEFSIEEIIMKERDTYAQVAAVLNFPIELKKITISDENNFKTNEAIYLQLRDVFSRERFTPEALYLCAYLISRKATASIIDDQNISLNFVSEQDANIILEFIINIFRGFDRNKEIEHPTFEGRTVHQLTLTANEYNILSRNQFAFNTLRNSVDQFNQKMLKASSSDNNNELSPGIRRR